MLLSCYGKHTTLVVIMHVETLTMGEGYWRFHYYVVSEASDSRTIWNCIKHCCHNNVETTDGNHWLEITDLLVFTSGKKTLVSAKLFYRNISAIFRPLTAWPETAAVTTHFRSLFQRTIIIYFYLVITICHEMIDNYNKRITPNVLTKKYENVFIKGLNSIKIRFRPDNTCITYYIQVAHPLK